MKSQIVTTITTLIDLETFDTKHSVSIEAEDPLPMDVVKAAVEGACKSTISSLHKDDEAPDEPTS